MANNKIGELETEINDHYCPPAHTCLPCSLVHLTKPHACPIVNEVNFSHPDYEEVKSERDNYREQLNSHVCPPTEISCSRSDYEKLKSELTNHNCPDNACSATDHQVIF